MNNLIANIRILAQIVRKYSRPTYRKRQVFYRSQGSIQQLPCISTLFLCVLDENEFLFESLFWSHDDFRKLLDPGTSA